MVIPSQSYVSIATKVLSDIPTYSSLTPDLTSGPIVMRVVSLQLPCFKYPSCAGMP